MLEPQRDSKSVRSHHVALVAGAGVAVAIVAFVVLRALVGFAWDIAKWALVIGVIALAITWVARRVAPKRDDD
jgi:hypothetical protein